MRFSKPTLIALSPSPPATKDAVVDLQRVLADIQTLAASTAAAAATAEPDMDEYQRPLQERIAAALDVLNVNAFTWRPDALGSLDFGIATASAAPAANTASPYSYPAGLGGQGGKEVRLRVN